MYHHTSWDLRTEFIVRRHELVDNKWKCDYVPVPWSKLLVMDLSNIITYHSISTASWPTARYDISREDMDNIPHNKIYSQLKLIPDMRDAIGKARSNRMRDMGLDIFHRRKLVVISVPKDSI